MKGETIQRTISLNGNVEPQDEVDAYPVLPTNSARIVSILKDVGDKVNRGTVIATLAPIAIGSSYAANINVLAPTTGTITSLPVSVGQTVSSSTSIASIGTLSSLKITIYVPEKYSSYLKLGLAAYVSFTATPGEEFNSTVTKLSPVVNAANRTIETTLSVPDDERIKSGMYASVRLVIQEADDAFVVPTDAVKDYNGQRVLYLVGSGNKVERVNVSEGVANDTQVQIIKGLKAGDKVITAGTVTEGSTVRVAEAASAGSSTAGGAN
jgi:RND family efflux transporter MFP subunit